MTDPVAIGNTLVELLYMQPPEGVTVGNTYGPIGLDGHSYGHETVNFMEATKPSSSSIDPSLLSIAASDIVHPEVYIAVDFTHQFVQTLKATAGNDQLIGKRPLDAGIMQKFADRIFVFVQRYFEYVRSYDGTLDFSTNITADFEKNPTDEHTINLFLNRIINYFLTSISVRRARKQIGTASLVFKDIKNPIQDGRGNYRIFFDAAFDIFNQLFAPMLPVTIWGKGRLYRNWHFPIFDGYITSTAPKDSNGFVEYNIECKDVLDLARVSVDMINPAISQYGEDQKVNSINIMTKPFFGHDHFTLIDRLIRGGTLVFNPAGRSASDENQYGFTTSREFNITPAPVIPTKFEPEKIGTPESLPLYALGRFTSGSITDLDSFDTTAGIAALEDIAMHKDIFTPEFALNYVSHRERARRVVYWGDKMTPYRIWATQTPDIYTSTFSNRLDIISEVADTVYYDFYVDGSGNVHYHPLRLGNEFLAADAIYLSGSKKMFHPRAFPHAQILDAKEIFSTTTLLNIDELVTFLRVSGEHDLIKDARPEDLNLYGSARDKTLIEKYGYRRGEIQNVLFNRNSVIVPGKITFLDVAAMVFLQFANAELYTRQSTIVFRPELELASPVLFTEDNNVFYVNSVDHNIVIGGDATTSINCSMGRKDSQLPPDLNSYLIANEASYNYKNPDPQELWAKLKAKEWKNYLDATGSLLLEMAANTGGPELGSFDTGYNDLA